MADEIVPAPHLPQTCLPEWGVADMPEAPDNKLLDESGFGRTKAARIGVAAKASA